ncbi:hypothetical protein FVE85_3574 [Porphyridium purpureum]|uniref:Glutaredoxin domain-containing protein n=1 Tax=Porphyridium purpureum TaxID=35688 RepID=A0A5J4YL44_PORPP|nr:hypothetical protein FVE85_3574 [Porphyridium purpureum]|eukprot:POR7485..scf249_10
MDGARSQQEPIADAPQNEEVLVYGENWCGDCRRATALLSKMSVRFRYIDLQAEPAQKRVVSTMLGRTHFKIPVVVTTDRKILVEPSNADLCAALNMSPPRDDASPPAARCVLQ